ncbi:uncharacterized protein RSE6_13245 [Rhynchosporium secalis]|uniref:Uncharacterized protein n=1 Tax=Rhynchosporium secalis TaxID=38038 RepID=A0A1E1MSF9_RHYSE|nr:uncharacterized protein RSE6_13245 [Rhynchosporium secalis]
MNPTLTHRPTPEASEVIHPPFFRLSQEIRDMIYDLVVGLAGEAPSSPAACGPRMDNGEQGYRSSRWPDPCTYKQPPADYATFSEWNRYDETPVRINSRSLIYVNHQVHAEMKEATSRLKASSGLKYILDCIIENKNVLWATWLQVPVVSSRADIVETQVRPMAIEAKTPVPDGEEATVGTIK